MVQMITDHKPLCDMFKKNLTDIHNARLQAMAEKTLDYNMVCTHLKGEKNSVIYFFVQVWLLWRHQSFLERATSLSLG